MESNFPFRNKEEQLQFVIKIFPLTDAGFTYVLMEQAEKHGILPELAEYAETHKNPQLRECCQTWLRKGNYSAGCR